MQFKKIAGFASALATLAVAAPASAPYVTTAAIAPRLAPASAPAKVAEKRWVMNAIMAATVAQQAWTVIGGLVTGDIEKRKAFTVAIINNLRAQLPGHNIVICNVDYSLSCEPEAKQTVFFKPKVGKKVSFDIVVFGKGCTFDRKGDGGFQNWAYTALPSCDTDGGHIAC